MESNVIDLHTELILRDDDRALTARQTITIELRSHYYEQERLRRAIEYGRLSQSRRIQQFANISELIEVKEEKLGDTE